MGMQVSRGVHTEVSAQDPVWGAAQGIGTGVPVVGGTEGMQSGGRAPDARSRSYDVVGAAEVLGGKRDGVHQGERARST